MVKMLILKRMKISISKKQRKLQNDEFISDDHTGNFMHDIYLYGMISASTVYILANNSNFPRPNEYAEIRQTFPSVGGEAVNSTIYLIKTGIKNQAGRQLD
jgi:hypothetical protein